MTVAKSTDPHPPLHVFSTLATQVAWPELTRRFKLISGRGITDLFGPTNGLMVRIDAGETADVAIIIQQSAHELVARGILTGCTDIAKSYVGLAVQAGAAKPDIGTVEALTATLLAARSIAYSRIGASGIFFSGLIQRLGIADEVNAKATIIPGGFTAERVANGEVELAVQQLSELKAVAGVDIVGPLPLELQDPAVLTAGVFTSSDKTDAARQLVTFLASADARPILRASGLEPVGG